jgi:hypothetical protein
MGMTNGGMEQNTSLIIQATRVGFFFFLVVSTTIFTSAPFFFLAVTLRILIALTSFPKRFAP